MGTKSISSSRVLVQAYLPAAMVVALDMLARRANGGRGVSRSQLVRSILAEYIELKMGANMRKVIQAWETYGSDIFDRFVAQQLGKEDLADFNYARNRVEHPRIGGPAHTPRGIKPIPKADTPPNQPSQPTPADESPLTEDVSLADLKDPLQDPFDPNPFDPEDQRILQGVLNKAIRTQSNAYDVDRVLEEAHKISKQVEPIKDDVHRYSDPIDTPPIPGPSSAPDLPETPTPAPPITKPKNPWNPW